MISISVLCVKSSYVNRVQVATTQKDVYMNQEPSVTPQSGVLIRTSLNDQGQCSVLLGVGEDVKLVFSLSAAAEVGHNLLSAVYAGRAEEALANYATKQTPPLSVEDLIKWMREGK